jgi:hypothetical protein
MDPVVRRHACVALRVELKRDVGTDLTAAQCEELIDQTLQQRVVGGAIRGSVFFRATPGSFTRAWGRRS